jgi:hypothetical protein
MQLQYARPPCQLLQRCKRLKPRPSAFKASIVSSNMHWAHLPRCSSRPELQPARGAEWCGLLSSRPRCWMCATK